jgi:hypothetical protein
MGHRKRPANSPQLAALTLDTGSVPSERRELDLLIRPRAGRGFSVLET